MSISSLAFSLLLACSASAALADEPLFREDFQNGLGPQWKPVEFTGHTQYTLQQEQGNKYIQATAHSSASGLAVRLPALSAQNLSLQWRWKIDKTPPGGSDRQIEKFDHTARLFVAFKTLLGPPRTINYVWANDTPIGHTFIHPSSGRSRFIVLQTGNQRAGEWILEHRNLTADWQLLFGDDKPPAVVGLGFMTDSDGTNTSVTGFYDDFQLRAEN